MGAIACRLELTPEKDAARLPEGLSLWALEVGLRITSGEAALAARLAPLGYRVPA